jgi:5-formyltetrahydrofolate cyclo-ligase
MMTNMSNLSPVSDQKAIIRQEILRYRRQLGHQERHQASLLIAARALALPELKAAKVIAGYWPLAGEVDTTLLISALHYRGHSLALPRVVGQGLSFHLWAPEDALIAGAFGVMEPLREMPEVSPDALLVPVVAADFQGNRIGYGRGFYDRALSDLRRDGPLLTVGLAFKCQMVEAVPVEGSDQKLNRILSDAKW